MLWFDEKVYLCSINDDDHGIDSIMWWYITHIIPYGFFLTFMKKNEKFSKFWDFDSFLFFKTWGSIAPPGSALCMPCSYVPLVLTQSNLRFSKLRTLQTLEKRKSNFSPEDELNCKFAPLQNMPKMCYELWILKKMNSNTFKILVKTEHFKQKIWNWLESLLKSLLTSLLLLYIWCTNSSKIVLHPISLTSFVDDSAFFWCFL